MRLSMIKKATFDPFETMYLNQSGQIIFIQTASIKEFM